jgi:hypothetical protein
MTRDPRRLGVGAASLAGILIGAWLGWLGVAVARLFITEECFFDGGGHCDYSFAEKTLGVAYQLLLIGSALAWIYAGYRGVAWALTLRPVRRAGLAAVIAIALLTAWLGPIVVWSL